MKIQLEESFIGIDKETITTGDSYALAELIKEEGKKDLIKPIFMDSAGTKIPTIYKSGGNLTLREVLAGHLFSENKTDKLAKSKLGYKILMCNEKEIEISQPDIEVIKKVVEEKELNGLILVQVFEKLGDGI